MALATAAASVVGRVTAATMAVKGRRAIEDCDYAGCEYADCGRAGCGRAGCGRDHQEVQCTSLGAGRPPLEEAASKEAAVLDHFREELIYQYRAGKLYERAKKDRRRFLDESFRSALRHV